MKRSGFGRRSCGAAFLLLPDLIQDASQTGQGCQEGTQNLTDQSGLAGQLTELVQLIGGQGGTLNNTALDGQSDLVLLGELAYDTGRTTSDDTGTFWSSL